MMLSSIRHQTSCTPRQEDDDAAITTSSGMYRRKYHVRAVCQSLAFLTLIGVFSVYNYTFDDSEGDYAVQGVVTPIDTRRVAELALMSPAQRRRAETLVSCDDIEKADPRWLTVFLCIGVLYMFLALAIVCDEFFVPALEEMSSKRRMNLSMDVAGATLMAAGGSAPELFTSLFGTFTESEIGFGTIVGSAVFNVLFVIAMCTIFSKEVLALTWWPLFRDSLFYAIGLVVLSIFVGVTSPEEIELWEAIVLFAMYFVYCVIMYFNADIYHYLTGKVLIHPEDSDDEKSTASQEQRQEAAAATRDIERPSMEKEGSANSLASALHLVTLQNDLQLMGQHSFRWQGTFRAGILKLLRDPHTWVETGGVGIVAKIAGDADYIFRKIDANGDGHLDKEELKRLFEALDCHVSPEELTEVFDILDVNKDGVISEEEFNKWYTTSAELIRSQTRQVFDKMDADHSGTLDKDEIKTLLQELDPHVTDEDVTAAVDEMYQHGSREEISFEEFEEWYEKSIIYERQKKAVEEDKEGAGQSLKPPYGEGILSWTQYIIVFPLVFAMVFTIPDVRRPGWGRWCYLSFVLSIAWIGGFAYLMVTWAETIGNTVGIPSVIMGLTVLAAGTSVPDLLSSVIVARRGSGDMAVSSSIGSNIFDILVGLPVPWILYTSWPSKDSTVVIASGKIWISIFVLIGMLVFVIAAVHCQGWKLTKTLGAMMIVFYFAFLAQAILLELPFETCISSP